MTTGLKTGRSIQEFWIDFLLEEEFGSDPEFGGAFASACGLVVDRASLTEVFHSVNDAFGEADLIVRFRLNGGGSVALLIENKITAGFQPGQADRYRQRGERGIADGAWQSYRMVLVAPQRYIRMDHGFDCTVSLEALSQWVCLTDPTRRAFKVGRLNRAIEKKNATGVQIVNTTMTAFRQWYGAHITASGAGFIPPVPRLAYWGDDWMEWTSSRLPPSWRFRHRTKTGVLDLSHPAFTEDEYERVRPRLLSGTNYCRVGKTRGGVALPLTPVTNFDDLQAAEPIARKALSVAAAWQRTMAEEEAAFLPNAETIAAMDEAKTGGHKSFSSVEALMADLEADD